MSTSPNSGMWIEAPHFVAGLDVRDEVVVRAAPILRYMLGWHSAKVRDYCERKGWKIEESE